jgi:hypothetical protein
LTTGRTAVSQRYCNELGVQQRVQRVPSVRIHPGPPSPHFFFLLWLSLTADMHMQLPDQYSGYVVRDLYCPPVYNYRLLQSLPSSSSQSRLRLQLFPLRFPHLLSRKYLLSCSWTPFPEWRLNISVTHPANNLRRPSTRLS